MWRGLARGTGSLSEVGILVYGDSVVDCVRLLFGVMYGLLSCFVEERFYVCFVVWFWFIVFLLSFDGSESGLESLLVRCGSSVDVGLVSLKFDS